MNNLVFCTNVSVTASTYTTSDAIAKYAGITRKSVNELIRRYKKDLKDFGLLPSEKEVLVGRGQPRKVWHLNRNQATLLITYLDNTPQVREFKKSLVWQFDAMQQELLERRVSYQAAKPVAKSLGESIKSSAAFDGNPFAYSNLNGLVYRQALGMTAKQLRDTRHIPQSRAITQYLTVKETAAVAKVKRQIAMLLDMGLDYSRIKAVLGNQGIVYNATLNVPAPAATTG